MPRLFTTIFFFMFIAFPIFSQATPPVITPDNIQQLQQLHVFGRGRVLNIEYTPNSDYLLVDTPLGLWRYQAQDLSIEPELLPSRLDFWSDIQPEENLVQGMTFSSDGTRFITYQDGYAQLWDATTETMISNFTSSVGYDKGATNGVFTPDSHYVLVTGDYDNQFFGDSGIYVFDAITGNHLQTLLSARTEDNLIFSFDGEYLITEFDSAPYTTSFSSPHFIKIWKTDTWEELYTIDINHWDWEIVFNPNGQDFILHHATLDRYEFATGMLLDTVNTHYEPTNTVIFSPDDSLLLLNHLSKMTLWDTQTGDLIYEHDNGGLEFRFSFDGRYLMNVTYDGSINVWDLTINQLLYTTFYDEEMQSYIEANEPLDPNYDLYITHQNPDFSPDGDTYFTTYNDTLYLRDTLTGELLHRQTPTESSLIEQARFNPSGTHIITISQGDSGWKKTIHLWNSTTWVDDVVIESTQATIISPDARYVAYGLDNEIWLLDTLTGENRLFVSSYRATITYLRFSEDSQFLFSGTEGEISKWWDTETGAFITSEPYIGRRNRPLELISCQENDVTGYCLLDTGTQESIFMFTGHVGNITYATFNHTGTQIATSGLDGTIRLWGIED